MMFSIRKMTHAEQMYCYTQSTQIMGQTGCIGHLRADMDTDGTGFFSTWDDHCTYLKTDDFKAEFDKVINAFRFEKVDGEEIEIAAGDRFLKNRSTLSKFCWLHPNYHLDTEDDLFGVRVDTDDYAYMFRLDPRKGEYNLYVYCYKRDWLDRHLENAGNGIRIIDSSYHNLYVIADGSKIKVQYADGNEANFVCRYIDATHLEVGSNLYHICEFAERIESAGSKVEPVYENLPEQCYSTLASTDEIIIIKCGEKGYYKTDISVTGKEEARELVDHYNKQLGVTKAQEAAMKVGSMFGFHVPGADPRNYSADGKLIKTEE